MEFRIARLFSQAVALCLSWLLISAVPAFAEEDLPVALQAGLWARENTGISVAITLGSDAGIDSQMLAENIEAGFARAFDVAAMVFVQQSERPGSTIAYFYGEQSTQTEPFQTGATMERMQVVVERYRALFPDS